MNYESADSMRVSYRRQHFFSVGFILLGILLALFLPESLYEQSQWVRACVDTVVRIVPSIGEFARVSDFPNTTRVVMALLWGLVIPLVILFDRLPNFLGIDINKIDQLGGRIWPILIFSFILIFVWPVIATIDADHMVSKLTVARVIQWVSHSRLALGLITSFYCLVEASFMYGFYRIVKYLILSK